MLGLGGKSYPGAIRKQNLKLLSFFIIFSRVQLIFVFSIVYLFTLPFLYCRNFASFLTVVQ
jgi:hypothetical protein